MSTELTAQEAERVVRERPQPEPIMECRSCKTTTDKTPSYAACGVCGAQLIDKAPRGDGLAIPWKVVGGIAYQRVKSRWVEHACSQLVRDVIEDMTEFLARAQREARTLREDRDKEWDSAICASYREAEIDPLSTAEFLNDLHERLAGRAEGRNEVMKRGYLANRQTAQDRICELEKQLAALDWRPITAEDLPKVGEEVGGPWGEGWRVDQVTRLKIRLYTTAEDWIDEQYLYHRPINPPAPRPT